MVKALILYIFSNRHLFFFFFILLFFKKIKICSWILDDIDVFHHIRFDVKADMMAIIETVSVSVETIFSTAVNFLFLYFCDIWIHQCSRTLLLFFTGCFFL